MQSVLAFCNRRVIFFLSWWHLCVFFYSSNFLWPEKQTAAIYLNLKTSFVGPQTLPPLTCLCGILCRKQTQNVCVGLFSFFFLFSRTIDSLLIITLIAQSDCVAISLHSWTFNDVSHTLTHTQIERKMRGPLPSHLACLF